MRPSCIVEGALEAPGTLKTLPVPVRLGVGCSPRRAGVSQSSYSYLAPDGANLRTPCLTSTSRDVVRTSTPRTS